MVIFLNFLIQLLTIIFGLLVYKLVKENKYGEVFVLTIVWLIAVSAYMALQPSYIPKGTVKPLPKVYHEPVNKEIKSNLLEAEDKSSRQARFEDKFDFREQVDNELNTK